MRTLALCCLIVLLAAAAPLLAKEAPPKGGWPADLNPVKFHAAPAHAPVVIAKPGKAARIVVSPNVSPATGGAVADLIEAVEQATGVKLERVDAAKAANPAAPAAADAPTIYIGDSPDAAAQGLVGAKMPVEGFAIKTAANRVYIVGNDAPIEGVANLRSNGTAWGVYEFCERFVGVRWYWPDPRGQALGVSIPKQPELVVAPVWLSDAPFFRKREVYPSGGPAVAEAEVGLHHQRLRHADTWPVRVIVHAPHDWSRLYKESRPEIFQLRSDGQRDFSMLCYGHPRTLHTYLEQIALQVIPDAKVDGPTRVVQGNNITVSPNDLSVACTCDHCKKLWAPEGGQYGTATRILAAFVQKLSEQVKQRWPEKTIIYLPYKNYTLAPGVAPGTKADEFQFRAGNVEVQICGMPGLAQYKEPSIDQQEQANIDGWRRLTGRRIQNWHYSCWPEDRTEAAYLFPHVIQAHYRANLDKTVGTFINGELNHWRRQNLSMYVWLKTLWNPEFNVDAAIDEYCRRMFGPAAGTMRQLVGMQCDGWEKSRWPDGSLSAAAIYETSFPRADVVRMEGLFDQAVKEASGDELAKRRLDYLAGPLRRFFAESKDYAEGTGRTTLDAFQTPEDPVIDGKLDDACWQGIKPVLLIRALDAKNPTAKYPTELKAVWSRQGITFGFRLAEPTPEKLARDIAADARDAALLWWNDNVELFLDVSGKRAGYYQLIVNANGAVWDGQGKDTSWNAQGMKTAAFIGKDFWSLEVMIPYSAFNPTPRPNTGTIWFGNFTRHRVTDRSAREIQRLSTTFAGPSNNEQAFGPIRFIER